MYTEHAIPHYKWGTYSGVAHIFPMIFPMIFPWFYRQKQNLHGSFGDFTVTHHVWNMGLKAQTFLCYQMVAHEGWIISMNSDGWIDYSNMDKTRLMTLDN
jgi:hypothetical protein